MNSVTTMRQISPEEAAEQMCDAHEDDDAWLDAFALSLNRRRASRSIARTMAVWDLSQAEAARLFGVSREAIGKWLQRGVPPERVRAISDLAAATDLLAHYVQRDRIPAVVRIPTRALREASLMDLLARGDTQTLLATCREMFRFERTRA